MVGTYRKRPVEIQAIQWTGHNAEELAEFAGANFAPTAAEDRVASDDPESTAAVLDKLHRTWILVYTGDWIIKGVQGEVYPCRPDVFAQTYEPVPDATTAPAQVLYALRHAGAAQRPGAHA